MLPSAKACPCRARSSPSSRFPPPPEPAVRPPASAFSILNRMHAKTGIASRRLKPTLGLLDPDNTRTLPPQVAASSGLDILSHAVESYTALPFSERPHPERPALRPAYQGSNPISDIWSLEALRIVARYLVRAVEDPSDDEARGQYAAGRVVCRSGVRQRRRAPATRHVLSGFRQCEELLRPRIFTGPRFGSAWNLGDSKRARRVPFHRLRAAPSGIWMPPKLSEWILRMRCSEDAGKILADRIIWFMQRIKTPNGLARSATPPPIFPHLWGELFHNIELRNCLRAPQRKKTSPACLKTL